METITRRLLVIQRLLVILLVIEVGRELIGLYLASVPVLLHAGVSPDWILWKGPSLLALCAFVVFGFWQAFRSDGVRMRMTADMLARRAGT
jgi:hypothetical protein